MRPPEIEDEKIIEAGKQLLEDSRRVTGFALRKTVGGGNPSRLVRVWEDYKRSREVVDSEPVQELPMEVEEALNEMTGSFLEQVRNLAQNLNSRAVKTAERRVADVMRSAKEQQENAEAELVDAAATVEDLEEQLGFVRAEGIKSRSELKKSQEEVDVLRKKAAELERDLAVTHEKLSKEREQRESAESSLKELHGRNTDLQRDKDDLRQERDELKKEFSQLQKRVDSIGAERDTLVKEKGESQAQLAAQNERLESALKQIEQLKAENVEARKSHAEAAKKGLEFEVQAGHYKEQLDGLMTRFSISESEVDSKKKK
jgi:chromosome segregation ATPase